MESPLCWDNSIIRDRLKSLKKYFKTNDMLFLLLCIICSTISVVVLFSVSQFRETINVRIVYVQAAASIGGVICAIILSLMDYRGLVNFWPLHVAVTWGLVALTFLRVGPFGYNPEGTGNYAWIQLPMGLTFQPTELAKISFIMTFAMHIDNVQHKINEPTTLGKLLLHLFAPIVIIHFQGDDGTAIVFAAIGCMMLFAGGLSFKYILGAIAMGCVALPIAMVTGRLQSYQLNRIMALFKPDDIAYKSFVYQQNAGRVAIGAGQISGRGLFHSDHYYVPMSQNDFIFSYMAEAFGFLGSIAIIGLLFAIAIKTLTTALRATDRVGSYICVGIFSALAWQIIINLGMNLTLLPVIGVTLPFFSAGGTSSLMLYLCVGLVLSVYSHNKKSLFDAG